MNTNDNYGQYTGPAEVRLVRLLPGPVERIWEYLTDDEKRSRWFAGGAMEMRQGGAVTLNMNHKMLAGDEPVPAELKEDACGDNAMHGRVTRFEPPRILAYTFGGTGESEVTFELTPHGKQVQLVLTHRSTGGDVPFIHGFAAGWHTHLDHLAAQISGEPRPPFWALHLKYRAHYSQRTPQSKP